MEDEEKCPSMVPISFPIKKRQGASTSTPKNSVGPSGDTYSLELTVRGEENQICKEN